MKHLWKKLYWHGYTNVCDISIRMQCNLLYYDSFWLVGGFFKELPLKWELVVANNRTYTCEWIAQVGEFIDQ